MKFYVEIMSLINVYSIGEHMKSLIAIVILIGSVSSFSQGVYFFQVGSGISCPTNYTRTSPINMPANCVANGTHWFVVSSGIACPYDYTRTTPLNQNAYCMLNSALNQFPVAAGIGCPTDFQRTHPINLAANCIRIR